jgi:hypothetical protein
VAEPFNEEQLSHLLMAAGARRWGQHTVDLRCAIKVPFYAWQFYYVLPAGKNQRELSRKEVNISMLMSQVLTTVFLGICIILGLLVIYLLKSCSGLTCILEFGVGSKDYGRSSE